MDNEIKIAVLEIELVRIATLLKAIVKNIDKLDIERGSNE